jgi:gp16 family phage-associated protein
MNTDKAKSIFKDSGVSVSEWARQNGFSSTLVYQVLEGKRKCLRGQSHQIALALGIKEGKNFNVEDLNRCFIEPR